MLQHCLPADSSRTFTFMARWGRSTQGAALCGRCRPAAPSRPPSRPPPHTHTHPHHHHQLPREQPSPRQQEELARLIAQRHPVQSLLLSSTGGTGRGQVVSPSLLRLPEHRRRSRPAGGARRAKAEDGGCQGVIRIAPCCTVSRRPV